MVWDLGEYESPENQPIEKQLAGGKIHVELQGEKLRGAFALVKIESPRFDYSVLTGRSLKEIEQAKPGKGPAAARTRKRQVQSSR